MKSIYSNFVANSNSVETLSDTNIQNPTNGQVLEYQNGQWINANVSGTSVSSVFGRTGAVIPQEGDYSLNLLSDVSISAPSIGQILKHNGTNFVNSNDYFQSFNVVAQDTIFNFGILYGSMPYDVNFSFLFQPVLPNKIFCGPTNLPSATPTFRSLQIADLPTINLTNLGDTNISSPINNQVLKYDSILQKWTNQTDTDTGLTSVGLNMPSTFIVNNTPLTSNGSISVSYTSQDFRKFLAGDLSNNGTVVFRDIVAADIPTLPYLTSFNGRTAAAVVPTEGDYSLNLLSDVSISSPSVNQILKYNGTNFVNSSDYYTSFIIGSQNSIFNFSITTSPPPYIATFDYGLQNQTANTFFVGPSTGIPATPTFRTVSIDEMNDVVITTPLNNQVLKYNGANWVNTDQNSSFIFYGSGTNITANQYFQYGSMNTNIEAANIMMGRNGRIINFVARLTVSPGLGNSRTMTIYKDNVSTGVALVFTGSSNSLAVTTNITFSAYTKIAIFSQQSGAAPSIGHCTLEYV